MPVIISIKFQGHPDDFDSQGEKNLEYILMDLFHVEKIEENKLLVHHSVSFKEKCWERYSLRVKKYGYSVMTITKVNSW